MKAVLGAAAAALLVGLGVGWLGHAVVYAEPDDGAERAVLLLGAGSGPGNEGVDVYVRHFRPGNNLVVGEYHQTPPTGLHPVVHVDARIACHVRLSRPTVLNQGGVVGFRADVVQVDRPVVAGFQLRWNDSSGPDFVFHGDEGQTVEYGPDGATVRPAWCD